MIDTARLPTAGRTSGSHAALATAGDAQRTLHRRERALLILCGLFLLVAHSTLILAQRRPALALWPFTVWLLCAIGGHVALCRRLPVRDPFLFPLTMLLSGWGLTLIDRLAPYFAFRQTIWLPLSCAVLLTVVWTPNRLRWFNRYRYVWLVGGLALLALTIVFGRNPSGGGPRLWLGIPDVYFQPSELLKVLLVAFLASYLADHRALLEVHSVRIGPLRLPPPRLLAPLLAMWSLCIVILLWHRDLGTAAIFFIVFFLMLYLASGQVLYVFVGGLLLLIGAVVAFFAVDVVRLRVLAWADPWPLAQGSAFQIVQSLLAFSSGGLFGQGAGQGAPTYIPVVHSDFILAAVGEEWGLVGVVAVIACFALLVMRGLRLAAARQGRPARAYLAAGLSLMIGVQSLLIMGGVLKIIPLTGVTLPFLSYGGSSLLASFLMVGLLLAVSAER
jgi:peptidoglycan glycosyltransferase